MRDVAIQQPSIPWYRDGFYARLADRLSATLTVYYDTRRPNARLAPKLSPKYRAEATRDLHLFGGRLMWSNAQVLIVLRKRFGVAILSWNSRYISLPVALLLGLLLDRKVVLWGHGMSPGDGRAQRMYRNLLGSLSSQVLIYSDLPLSTFGPKLREKTVVVGNALFRERTAFDLVPNPRLSASSPGLLRMIHVGQIRTDRRLDLALDSVDVLRNRGWFVEMRIVGDGVGMSDLLRSLDKMENPDCVEVLGSVFDSQEIRGLWTWADVAVYPAGAGLGATDALTHGVPVAICGSPELQAPEASRIFEYMPGLVDASWSALGLADCIERAACSPETVKSLADVRSLLMSDREHMVASVASVVE